MNNSAETDKLTLRMIREDDAPFLFELMNTEKWYSFIGDRKITNLKAAREYINAKMHPDLAVAGFTNYVMISKAEVLPVGTCSLHNREGIEGLDVGYALLPEFEGRGYATEGAVAMIQRAFYVFHQPHVNAIATDQNKPSCALLEKIGFQHHAYTQLPRGNEDLKLYQLLKSDFEKSSDFLGLDSDAQIC